MERTSRLFIATGIVVLLLFTLFSVTPVMAESQVQGLMQTPNYLIQTGTTCTAPTIAKGYSWYVVKKGDSLQSISSSFGVPVATIVGLNPNSSFTRNQVIMLPAVEGAGLWDNQLLCSALALYPNTNQAYTNTTSVPVTGGSSSTSTSSSTTTTTTTSSTTSASSTGISSSGAICVNVPTPAKGYGVYIVRKGDSLASIASSFGISQSTITDLNPNASFARNSYLILPGVEAPGLWDNQLACK